MEEEKVKFSKEDFDQLKKWVATLNSSEGKFQKEFEEFWSLFFQEGESLSSLMEKLKFVKASGTLSTWFSYLRIKIICFSFVFKDLNIGQISTESGISDSKVATILRNFFVETFPYLENYFNSLFHIGRKRKTLSFSQMVEEKKFSKNFSGIQDEDIMKTLDVTSLHDWPTLLKKYKRKFHEPNPLSKRLSPRLYLKRNSRIFIELFLLIGGGYFLIIGTENLNKFYEKKLADKINIFDIQVKDSGKEKTIGKENTESIVDESLESTENLDDIVKNEIEEKPGLNAFDTESEVVVTSWKALPKDFKEINLEQSDYEEETNTAVRDIVSGNKKIYRVIMESVTPGKTKDSLDSLLLKFKGTQVDNVKPGTYVPGGLYYNVLIPQENLKEFLYQVMNTDEATLYETRTRLQNPPGKGRVFIWIKAF